MKTNRKIRFTKESLVDLLMLTLLAAAVAILALII